MFKEFPYYLTEEDGRSLYVQNGVVSASGARKPLQYSPDGWQDLMIGWERNMDKYYGLTRNFTLPLTFYGDAAFILKYLSITTNIERKVYLLIQQLKLVYGPDWYKFVYKYLYKGELDFSTLKGSQDRVTVNIMEGGLVKLFKANENTKYTYPLDDPEAIDVLMDGIKITGIYKWTILEWTAANGASGQLPTMLIKSEEQKAPGIAVFPISGGYALSYGAINNDTTEYFLSDGIPPEGGVGTFTGTINLSGPNPSFPANISIWVWNTIAGTRTQIPLFVGPEASVISINKQVPVNAGDRFFLDIEEYHLESSLTFTIQTRQTASIVKAFKPITLFRKLVKSITGSADNAQSNLLIANENLVVTSGDGIRGFSTAKVQTSLSEFFEDYSITCFGGLSVQNGKIMIEDRASYFDASNPISLGRVRKHEWSYASDLIGNVYKIGSLKPEIEDVNGRYDPNGSSNYTTPITRIPKDIDLVGPYKKGPYEMEALRANMDGKLSTDTNSDNNCFVLDVQQGVGHYILDRTPTVTTAPEFCASPDTIYNVRLTPKNLFFKQKRWIRSQMQGFEGSKVRFGSGDKNTNFSSIIDGVIIDEDRDEIINDANLGTKLWLPRYHDFETIVPLEYQGMSLVDIMEENPNRCFEFTDEEGNTFKGFNIKSGLAPNTQAPQQFKLLSAPDNDLTKLII